MQENGIIRPAEGGREARTDIDRALEYALALNCEQVHVMAGSSPPVKMQACVVRSLSTTFAMLPNALHHTVNAS